MINKNFCYWQEIPPTPIPMIQNKICLLRQNEYKLEKEAGIENKTNIFCPYSTEKEAERCFDYEVSKRIYEKNS